MRVPKTKQKYVTCRTCGRSDVCKPKVKGAAFPFHYSRVCGLPCEGGSMVTIGWEERAMGFHGPSCKKCHGQPGSIAGLEPMRKS